MLVRVILIMVVLILSGCKQPTYDGFIYPDSQDLFEYTNIGEFPSLEECRAASKAELKRLHSEEPKGTYQCGKDCISPSGYHTVSACKSLER